MTLFLRDGYDAVSVDAIAQEAGLSLRSFYRYFTAKEEVLDPLLNEGSLAFIEAFSQRPPEEDPFVAAIEAYKQIAEAFDSEAYPLHIMELHVTVPALRGRLLERQRVSQELLVARMRERVGSEMTELELRGRAGLIVLALSLPLELAATGKLDLPLAEAYELVLHGFSAASASSPPI